MAKKRLAFDVEEDLHTRLKQEAAERGVPMSTLCSGLLSAGLDGGGRPVPPVELEREAYSSLPLNELRDRASTLAESRPQGWESAVRAINAEIVKRYVVR